jgi:3-oxoacyl-[acyl-carrier-protein] synthase II
MRAALSEDHAPRRVVVTGMAVVGPEDPMALVERLLPAADMRFVDAPIAAALAAAKLALDDAGLDPGLVGARAGVILDSSGEFETQYRFFEPLEKEGPASVEPFLFPTMLANAAASRVAVQFGLKLVSRSFGGCFAAGENAVGDAFRFLRRHASGIILAGGVRGYGSGAGLLVLEDRDSAIERGARIFAEITCFNESFDPNPAPDPDSDCGALARAIKGFGVCAEKELEIEARGSFGSRAVLRLSKAL